MYLYLNSETLVLVEELGFPALNAGQWGSFLKKTLFLYLKTSVKIINPSVSGHTLEIMTS